MESPMTSRFALPLLALLLLALPAAAQDPVAAAIKSTLERHAAIVVPIRVRVRVEIQGRRQEVDNRILGTIVDPRGLVMAARDAVDPTPPDPRMRDQIKIIPLALEVLLDEGKTVRPARIVHSDPALGIAFLQIESAGGKPLPALDFKATAAPEVGQRLFGPARLDAGFGHAPFVSIKRVTGRIKKPREAWLTAGEGVPGLPSFNAAGALVGIHVPVTPATPPKGPGARGDGTRTFLIEPAAVTPALGKARASAAALREARGEGEAKPAPKKSNEGGDK